MTLTLRDITRRHMIENALRRSEEQYRSVIETASDAIITTDLQGTIITWNKGAENIYGYSADEIINKSFIVLFPEHFTLVNQNRMLEHFAQHNMGIIFQDTQIPAKRKDGSEFIAEGSVSKWESNEGIFLTAIVRGITERKQAEEALRRSEIQYRSVIETAYDAIITTDNAGIIVGWNNGAEKIFGYSVNEIINKPYLTLMPERLHAKYLQRLKGFGENSNNVQRGESFGRRKDGSEFPAEGSLSMWKTDEGVFFTTTARDISDRKLAEDLINKVNNCLLSFTPDPDKNIQTIVETVGLILNADGASYHKIAGRYVTIKSQWNMQSSENSLPPIKAPNFRAMFAHNSDKACIYIPLHKQSFESKESSRMHYQFETSIAVPIKDYNTFMGTLNVSFKNKRILNQNEENALTILAKAIGTEEYRKRYLAKLNKNQRELTAAKKRLDSFSQKILSIREEEKKSLSNNLHDEIGSMVVALSSCLTISKEEIIENNPDRALQRINQAETALRQSVDNLKKIVVDLRPPQFEIIGLSGILKELCTSFYHQTAIDLDCRFNIKDKHVSDNAAIAIYRVCQEALNNIVKHAKAKRVKIEIGSEKRKITVSISDDGRGFDFRKYNDSYKGEIKLGLISMRERIEALGGTFIIESTQNQGTTIHATLPSR